jgi:hypothetical protein
MPGSVWDLTYTAWLKLVRDARQYKAQMEAKQRAK